MMRRLVLLALSLFTLAATSATRPVVPQKPDNPQPFHVPRENSRALDENWIYQQTLYDAEEDSPEDWGALPVAMQFTHNGRGFIATLHTVFRTVDAGRTWTNLDPAPPPQFSPAFTPVREPYYLNDLAIHPASTSELAQDSVFLAVFNANQEQGVIRLIRSIGAGHYMWPDTVFTSSRWLTTIVLPDAGTAIAIAGLDARIYRNDSIQTSRAWDTLSYSFAGSWVKEATVTGNSIYTVGSNHWLTLDGGLSWQTAPASDTHGDADISFSSQNGHAIVCGGADESLPSFVRTTTDFGQTWSPRRLTAFVPLRSALMVNDTLGFVAGGNINTSTGQIWRTENGGESWELDLQTNCDFTELQMVRESGAHVNIIAAGYYADFRGAIWRSQIFMPDTGTVIYATPDTLQFLAVVGTAQEQIVTIRNDGTTDVTLTDVTTVAPFSASCCPQNVLLLAGETLDLTITFAPPDSGEYFGSLRVLNDYNQVVEIVVQGTAQSSTARANAPLAEELALSVYPNPGNAEFRISYTLPHATSVELRIFDVNGRAIATLSNEMKPAGEHVLSWNARDLASGIYFVSLQSAAATKTEKIVLVK